MTGIVVGVDGSDHSRCALAWGMREAALRGVSLTAVTVRPVAVLPLTRVDWPLDKRDDLECVRTALRELVDKVASDLEDLASAAVVIAVKGDPAQELLRQARDAEMLVVGSRGSGGFERMLMGSVSTKVVHHATCPVVVIP